MYGNLGEGLNALFKVMSVLLVILTPLAVWKLVEIVVWLFNHVQIGFK